MDILKEAIKMLNRENEKDREYGPFSESMERAAIIATQMCEKEITTNDMFKIMIALKLGRLRYNEKPDTILDGVCYLVGLNNFNKNKKDE